MTPLNLQFLNVDGSDYVHKFGPTSNIVTPAPNLFYPYLITKRKITN